MLHLKFVRSPLPGARTVNTAAAGASRGAVHVATGADLPEPGGRDCRQERRSRGGCARPGRSGLRPAAGGSSHPAFKAYATTKQGNLATLLALAREFLRLRFPAVEAGFNPGSDLGRDADPALRFLTKCVQSPIAPLVKSWSNPQTAARVITGVLTDPCPRTGGYFEEKGNSMRGSGHIQDPKFQNRYVAETGGGRDIRGRRGPHVHADGSV